jgi:hypothetical protein
MVPLTVYTEQQLAEAIAAGQPAILLAAHIVLTGACVCRKRENHTSAHIGRSLA